MEIKSFAPTSLERDRYDAEQEGETRYKTLIAQLAAEKIKFEKQISDFTGKQNHEETIRISKVALQSIRKKKRVWSKNA